MRSVLTAALLFLACLGAVALGHELASAPARVVVVEADPVNLPAGVDPVCVEVER